MINNLIDIMSRNLTVNVPIPDKKKKFKFLFSHFFVLPQKVLSRPLRPFEAPQGSVKLKI